MYHGPAEKQEKHNSVIVSQKGTVHNEGFRGFARFHIRRSGLTARVDKGLR